MLASLVLSCVRLEHGTEIELQFVEYLFIDIAIRVDEVAEELIVLDGLQVFVGDVDAACAAGIGLDFIHDDKFVIRLFR